MSASSDNPATSSTRRARRAPSAMTTRAPESEIPNASSSPVHHALSGTATAPIATVAKNATDHSG